MLEPRHIPDCYVYTLLCQGHGGEGYVKFGFSQRIGERIRELKRGTPFQEFKFAVVQCFNRGEMRAVERALHEKFASRRTKGEWFLFDFASPADKREYNDGCREVFSSMHNPDMWWAKIDQKAVRAHEEKLRQEREEKEAQYIRHTCANEEFCLMPVRDQIDAVAAGVIHPKSIAR